MKGAGASTAFKPEALDSGSLNKKDVHYVFMLINGMKSHGVPGLWIILLQNEN